MRRFTASDGADIGYDDEGAGRPLVLLHGLMAHGGFFDRQRPLGDDFRIIRVDLRGHRGSGAGAPPPRVETLARDIAELAAHLDLEDAIGVGWSLGAAVLWQVLTGPASDRFAGAVVIDMTPRVMNDDGWDLGLSPDTCDARTRAIGEDFPSFATAAGAAIFVHGPDAASDPLAAWAGEEFAGSDANAIRSLWESLVGQDFRPALSRIRQPTLVVHGAESHLYGPETADHLVAALPSATKRRFEGCGHAPHIEQPELFNRLLRDFAAGLPPLRGARTHHQTQTA